MSKHLTLRQLKFIQIYIETGNATKAAMKAYNCKSLRTATSIGSENLTKPDIACEIEKYRKKGGLSIEKADSAINRLLPEVRLFGAKPSVVHHVDELVETCMMRKFLEDHPNR